jgi:hypothetical protein
MPPNGITASPTYLGVERNETYSAIKITKAPIRLFSVMMAGFQKSGLRVGKQADN